MRSTRTWPSASAKCARSTPISLPAMARDEGPVATAGPDRLTAGQRRQIKALLGMLASDEHAPTAIRDPEHAARMHVADSLTALELPPVLAAERIADIGSG